MKDDIHKTISDSLNIENEIVDVDKSNKENSKEKSNQLDLFNSSGRHDTSVSKPSTEEKQVKRLTLIDEDTSKRDIKKDYEEIRGSYHQLSSTGQQALEGILQIAEETEHPRAYEVVSQLLKTLSENNSQMMKLHHDLQDLEDKKNEKNKDTTEKQQSDKPSHTTNNSIFVGSTAELQKMINEMSG